MPLSFSSPISSTSPVVAHVMERRRKIHVSSSKIYWSLFNLAVAIFLYLEAQFYFCLSSSSKWRGLVSGSESALCFVFIVNTLVDAINHFFPFGIGHSFGSNSPAAGFIAVSPTQRKLLGVDEADLNYGSIPKFEPQSEKKPTHPFGFAPPLDGSFIASSTPTRIGGHQMANTSVANYSTPVSEASSWQFFKQVPQSPITEQSTSSQKITASPDGVITSQKKLLEFIASLDSKDDGANKTQDLNSSPLANQSSSFFWQRSFLGSGGNNSGLAASPSTLAQQDYSPILKKLAYQMSSPIPTIVSATGVDESQGGSTQGPGVMGISLSLNKNRNAYTSTELFCAKVGIDPIHLGYWLQNLRLWISQTILARLIKEIKSINQTISKHGLADLIGQAGVEKLRKCGMLIPEATMSINAVIPFLDITTHQDYLYQRLLDLSKGGAIADYRWDSGSQNFKGQAWSDKYPSDSEIIMNCIAAYLDNCMPANYNSAEGKPFSSIYYSKVSDTKSAPQPTAPDRQQQTQQQTQQVEKCLILQTAQRPPVFYLQLQEEKHEFNPGRNNLFHAFLMFLHHIKTKQHGNLGRIHCGVSGINVLWIID